MVVRKTKQTTRRKVHFPRLSGSLLAPPDTHSPCLPLHPHDSQPATPLIPPPVFYACWVRYMLRF
jgi:hypothetical protein